MRSFLRNSVEHSSNLVFADAKGCDIRQFQAPGAGKYRTFIKFSAWARESVEHSSNLGPRVSLIGQETSSKLLVGCHFGVVSEAWAPLERGESGRYAALRRASRGRAFRHSWMVLRGLRPPRREENDDGMLRWGALSGGRAFRHSWVVLRRFWRVSQNLLKSCLKAMPPE